METRISCPRCGQDWLLSVRLVFLELDAVLCPECNALWPGGEKIGADTFRDYETYMVEQGRKEPEAAGELLVRGLLLRVP